MFQSQKIPPVAWWDLWPNRGTEKAKNPAIGYPKDGRHFLALGFGNGFTIEPFSNVSKSVSLLELGWYFRLGAVAVTANPDLYLDLIDYGSGKKLVTKGNAFSFVGGEGGKQFVTYPYQFPPQSTIQIVFYNESANPIKISCALLGTYIRGDVL